MLKKSLKFSAFLFLLVIVALLISNYTINKSSEKLLFSKTSETPKKRVGIILGTVKYLSNNQVNLYYKYRLQAAVELYKAQKISYILVSGDNSAKDYDEPTSFKEDLITLGVPSEKIYLDYAGFRTLDSMVRAKEIFGIKDCIIISQKFHNQRAIFLAKRNGIKAIGYSAKDVPKPYGLKTQIREKFARAKVFIDLLIAKKPKFLGEKIEIK